MSRPRFILMVTGSRDAVSPENCAAIRKHLNAIAKKVPPKEYEWHFVHGAARGADVFCAEYVRIMGWCDEETIHPFAADWEKHGKAAGPIRNAEMVAWVINEQSKDLAKVGCVAFPAKQDYDPPSQDGCGGTCDCMRQARGAGITVHVVPLEVSEERSARLARKARAVA